MPCCARAGAVATFIQVVDPSRLVLVVEDYDDTRILWENNLSRAGYDVVTAQDGAQAIDLATRLHPRIVLMDLALPGIDGWEATRAIRRAVGDVAMSIIAVSAMIGMAARSEALRVGCDGFVAKPCTPDTIVSVVKTFADSYA